jgi:hypothetical protein
MRKHSAGRRDHRVGAASPERGRFRSSPPAAQPCSRPSSAEGVSGGRVRRRSPGRAGACRTGVRGATGAQVERTFVAAAARRSPALVNDDGPGRRDIAQSLERPGRLVFVWCPCSWTAERGGLHRGPVPSWRWFSCAGDCGLGWSWLSGWSWWGVALVAGVTSRLGPRWLTSDACSRLTIPQQPSRGPALLAPFLRRACERLAGEEEGARQGGSLPDGGAGCSGRSG